MSWPYLGFDRFDSSTQNPAAQPILVPIDCNFVLVGYANYSGAGNIDFSTLTLGGVSGSAVVQTVGTTAAMECGIWRVANPGVGAQNIQWTQNAAPTEGTRVWTVFLGGVYTADPIRDSDSSFNTTGAAIALTVDSSVHDFVFSVMSTFSDVADLEAGANQLAIQEPATAFNTCFGGIGMHLAPGASTTTYTGDAAATDDPAMATCSVRIQYPYGPRSPFHGSFGRRTRYPF